MIITADIRHLQELIKMAKIDGVPEVFAIEQAIRALKLRIVGRLKLEIAERQEQLKKVQNIC